ncbi:GMC-OxRdtase-N domain-containing protein [Mycena kentingensis (nom. inval.)]|nr:GMC-OxRdtase-N domain-containing protein [Mycena kentingensis (nom. inval.)]
MAAYDIVFAGGGTTACVVAGRIADAAPHLSILILEAGKHSENVKVHVQPGRYFANLASGADSFTYHQAKPSKALDNRQVIVPAGKTVGGGSSVNFMMYTRGSPSDMDDWEKLGNPGWGAKDLIPLANKARTRRQRPQLSNILAQMQTRVARQWMEVMAARDSERGFVADANDLSASTINKYSPWSRYMSASSGKRSDAAHHYIYNKSRKNVHILTQCRVKRVIFEGTRAVGVEYINTLDKTRVESVRAAKFIVLASGAFGSPAILERQVPLRSTFILFMSPVRSGIGGADLLGTLEIPQLVDLPGVGENYNDHDLLIPPYMAPANEITMDEIFRGDELAIKPYEERWLKDGKGMMAHNGIEACIKIRPNARDLDVLGPDFASRWETFFKDQPDKPVMCMGPAAAYTGKNPAAVGHKFFSMIYYIEYPSSIGRTHIQGPDPFLPLAFEPGYLDKRDDVALLRWSYKLTREMARRMDSYRGEFSPDHPQFTDTSRARCGPAEGPVPINAPDIEYTKEDDEAIDRFHRAYVSTAWHALGTCAMKPRSVGGVVDSRLNVYGVQGLKIADLSIVPTNVGCNTYSTALMVGEKAATILAEELGVKV